jgi:hypothetical protein
MKSIKYLLFAATVIILSILGCKKDKVSTTDLEIRIIDEQGIYVSGASVKLYKSSTDMQNDTNQFGVTQISDVNGKVTFSNLAEETYFWFAERGCTNNSNGINTTPALDLNMTRVVTTTLSGTGTFKFTNTSPDQYQIYLNGYLLFTANAGYTYTYVYVPVDTYYIEAVQVNGSTDETFTDAIICGSTVTVTFP